jgi:hypothetical protein
MAIIAYQTSQIQQCLPKGHDISLVRPCKEPHLAPHIFLLMPMHLESISMPKLQHNMFSAFFTSHLSVTWFHQHATLQITNAPPFLHRVTVPSCSVCDPHKILISHTASCWYIKKSPLGQTKKKHLFTSSSSKIRHSEKPKVVLLVGCTESPPFFCAVQPQCSEKPNLIHC